jgi:magnesium-transporting ATPase (P-type)
MLTGDKIETAKCIAIAIGMNKKTEKVNRILQGRILLKS